MATAQDARCVHHRDPLDCQACWSLARAMRLVGRWEAPLPGWYEEQSLAAWGRACGIAGPLLFIETLRGRDRPRGAHSPSPLDADLCECGAPRGHR